MTDDRKSLTPHYCAVLLSGLLLLLAIACGGGDDGANGGANGADGTNGTDGASATPAENGVEPTLEGLSTAFLAGVDGKVTYRYISNFGQHPDGVWTDYHLEGRTRQDWHDEPNEFQTETYAIVNGEEGYVCSTTVTTVDCTRTTPEEVRNTFPIFIPVTEIPNAILGGIEGLRVEQLPDENIASLKALCFDLESPGRVDKQTPPATEKIKICFTEDGTLLLMSRTVTFTDAAFPTAQLDLEATEVTDASPSDFEPPASPVG